MTYLWQISARNIGKVVVLVVVADVECAEVPQSIVTAMRWV